MRDGKRGSGLIYVLGALCAGAIVAAFLVVGPPSQSATLQSRVVTAAQGVVQSTVSGSGNLQPDVELNLGFKTSGVVKRIYMSEGQHVADGQLLAELDPEAAEVTLEQAKATLQSSEATLAQLEESGGETAAGSGGSSARTAATASAASARPAQENGSADLATTAATGDPTTTPTTTGPSSHAGTGTSPAGQSPGTGTGSTTGRTTPGSGSTNQSGGTTHASTGAGERPTSSSSGSQSTGGGAGSGSTTAASAGSSEKTKQSAATREANLASARAAVRSDRLAVQSDEQAVANTKLYAPQAGTIVSLTGEVGETVSGNGTTKASSSSSSSSGAGSGSAAGAGTGAAGRGSSSADSSSSTGSGSSSSSAFAVLSDLSGMQLIVPLSESEVVHVSPEQPATITVEALEGVKLAAHVESVATLSTSNSGVVSYDVTFQLDQMAPGLRPGMSASAEVVVEQQQEGVNVPTSAISGGAVTVVEGTKHVRRSVVTGLAGNSSTIILSGLKAGEKVALPLASSSSSTSILSRLGSRAGGLSSRSGLGGGLGLGGAGGGAAFFRGGG